MQIPVLIRHPSSKLLRVLAKLCPSYSNKNNHWRVYLQATGQQKYRSKLQKATCSFPFKYHSHNTAHLKHQGNKGSTGQRSEWEGCRRVEKNQTRRMWCTPSYSTDNAMEHCLGTQVVAERTLMMKERPHAVAGMKGMEPAPTSRSRPAPPSTSTACKDWVWPRGNLFPP